MLLEDVRVEIILEFLLIFFIAFVASFAKDYLNILQFKSLKISIAKILLSTVTASILVFAGSIYVQAHIGIRGLMVVAFVVGLMGFNLLEKISTPEGFMKFVRELLKFVKDLMDFFEKRNRRK